MPFYIFFEPDGYGFTALCDFRLCLSQVWNKISLGVGAKNTRIDNGKKITIHVIGVCIHWVEESWGSYYPLGHTASFRGDNRGVGKIESLCEREERD